MSPVSSRLSLFSAIILGVCAGLCAQSQQSPPPANAKEIPAIVGVEDALNGHVKEVPAHVSEPSSVFQINNSKGAVASAIRILPEDEMTREDRDLVANAESSIRERAGIENLEFIGDGWTNHQLVCPALPNHLFLRFTRDSGTRQMSMFTAAIPRNGNGRVHIIPIVRKGYSLFSPAPIGALTIAAFNRIRAEEGEGAGADWLGTGLCYAAISGANPELEDPILHASEGTASIPPTLMVNSDGGAVISFDDVSDASKPMEWTMTFARNGKLIKASHIPASRLRPIKGVPVAVEAKP